MKKTPLLFIFYVTLSIKLLACNYVPISFCETSKSSAYLDNLIAYGKIISIDNNGIDFEIIDVLKGEETRTVIRIWDGLDFECNGTWSMAASELGEINDTLIIVLPKISEKKSTWEIIGDYRRPDFFGYTSHLKVDNDIIYGFISGSEGLSYVEEQASYDNFKNSWITNQDCSSVVLGTKDYGAEKNFKILTLKDNKFKILSNDSKKYQVNIFNVLGLKIESEVFINREIEIDLSHYSSGMYFINLRYDNNRLKTIKLIKK